MDYSRFQVVYASVPEKLRNGVIAVVDERPYSWNAAYLEMSNGTELGEKIFEKLIETAII